MTVTKFTRREATHIELDRWARIAKDTKKEFHLRKEDSFWYWSDRDESDNPENWHGPFCVFGDCLYDAVEPYLSDEDQEQCHD